jgi:hypothetical protein
MRKTVSHIILWGLRLGSIALMLWWPAMLRDPVYTPRQARLASQALHLPSAPSVASEDERAMSIFWGWEHRKLVSSRWTFGPYRGVRNPEGRTQTLLVLGLLWGVGSVVLFCLAPRNGAAPEPRKSGPFAFLSTPIWRWFTR